MPSQFDLNLQALNRDYERGMEEKRVFDRMILLNFHLIKLKFVIDGLENEEVDLSLVYGEVVKKQREWYRSNGYHL
jgi:hypothetical protein